MSTGTTVTVIVEDKRERSITLAQIRTGQWFTAKVQIGPRITSGLYLLTSRELLWFVTEAMGEPLLVVGSVDNPVLREVQVKEYKAVRKIEITIIE